MSGDKKMTGRRLRQPQTTPAPQGWQLGSIHFDHCVEPCSGPAVPPQSGTADASGSTTATSSSSSQEAILEGLRDFKRPPTNSNLPSVDEGIYSVESSDRAKMHHVQQQQQQKQEHQLLKQEHQQLQQEHQQLQQEHQQLQQQLQQRQSPEVCRFQSLPPKMQQRVLHYPTIIATAFHEYPVVGDAKEALHRLMRRTPEMLTTVDNEEYMESPLGQALVKNRAEIGEFYAELAEKSGLSKQVCRHRNSNNHNLLMLAVQLGDERPDLLRRLLDDRPEQVHECYDYDGRNVLHHCAIDNCPKALEFLLNAVSSRRDLVRGVASALQMPDSQQRTPLHYMAACGSLCMLEAVKKFVDSVDVVVDFDCRWPQLSGGVTPLMLAAEAGRWEACQWLLEVAGVRCLRQDAEGALKLLAESGKCDDQTEKLEGLLRLNACEEAMESSFLDDSKTDDGVSDMEDDDEDDEEEVEVKIEHQEQPEATAKVSQVPARDLRRLNSERRSELSQRLRDLNVTDQFVSCLKRHVPQLNSSHYAEVLQISEDPAFLSVTFLPDSSLDTLVNVLHEIGQSEMAQWIAES